MALTPPYAEEYLSTDAGTLTVRRSAGMVRVKGEGAEMVESSTKTSKPRVIDLDPATPAPSSR